MADTFNTTVSGTHAEADACSFLQKKGLRLLEKNYRCWCGELDLIMQDGDEIVFVEVRLRKQGDFGSGVESVSKAKQRKLIKTSLLYLQKKGWLDQVNCRFDVIGLDQEERIDWVQNAFGIGFI